MASPTAIPHCETSAHHQAKDLPTPASSSSFSRSPTNTSPNPLVSPIYTSAGRSAFSLPGPNSSSTSPTTTSWYSAGFASNNSQRVRSPTANFVNSTVSPQREYFYDTSTNGTTSPNVPTSGHFRKTSFGSTSRSSSISSADLMSEPLTPKAMDSGSISMGRVPSMSMGSSFEQIKGHRGSWGPNSNSGWNGLNTFRGPTINGNLASPPSSGGGGGAVENGSAAAPSPTSMSGILRKFSFGSGTSQPIRPGGAHTRSPSSTTAFASSAPQPQSSAVDVGSGMPEQVDVVVRGRQSSVGAGVMQKRRPSPMGERLLMGHFNAH